MSEKKRGKGWLFAILAVVLAGAGWLWLSGAFSPWSFTRSVTVEPQGYFFRVKASYTHGDEKIDFDYVAVCGYRTTVYKDGSRSNDGTYAPKVMIEATGDGGALMIRTPRACRGQPAPVDLLPFIIWFDDVADLTFGMGYASPDAYDSPHAQVKFHGATIEPATAEDWKAWRARAEAEYEPKGMLPGPWGYSYPAGHGRTTNVPYDPARRIMVRNCKGYFRLKLPEEARPQIREMWPEDRPKYWEHPPTLGMPYAFYPVPESAVGQTSRRIYRNRDGTFRMAVPYPSGREYFNFPAFNGGNGVPTRRGGGVLPEGAFVKYPADTFPLLPRSRSMDPVPTTPVDSYPRRLLVREDMKGFVACGGDAPVDYVELFDSKFRAKKHPIYANDELIAEDYNSLDEPNIIYQRDEYVFDHKAWPGLM